MVNPVRKSSAFQQDGSFRKTSSLLWDSPGVLNPAFALEGIISSSPLQTPIEAELRTGQTSGLSNGVNPARNTGKPFNTSGRVVKKSPSAGKRSMMPDLIKIKYVLIGLALIAIGIGIFFTLSQSEEKRVKQQFHLLSEGVSKETGENIFTMDQKIKKIGSLFDDTCDMTIPVHSISGQMTREEITGYAARGRLYVSELDLTFHDFMIAFPQEGEARVRLTAQLTGKTTTGEAIHEAHEIECHLKKIEKKWMFNRIEVVEVLKK